MVAAVELIVMYYRVVVSGSRDLAEAVSSAKVIRGR